LNLLDELSAKEYTNMADVGRGVGKIEFEDEKKSEIKLILDSTHPRAFPQFVKL
jgi:hypothetical protein